MLINATSVGTNTQNDGRRSLVKMETVKAELEDTIINSQCVLATGTNYVVLWTGDSDGGGDAGEQVGEFERAGIDRGGYEHREYQGVDDFVSGGVVEFEHYQCGHDLCGEHVVGTARARRRRAAAILRRRRWGRGRRG